MSITLERILGTFVVAQAGMQTIRRPGKFICSSLQQRAERGLHCIRARWQSTWMETDLCFPCCLLRMTNQTRYRYEKEKHENKVVGEMSHASSGVLLV